MLAIRLKRGGKKHQPTYRLVVAERRSKLTGRFVDDLGFYNPYLKKDRVDAEKVLYWLDNGAKPSDSVYNLLVKKGIIKGKKRAVHSRNPEKEKAVAEAEEAKGAEINTVDNDKEGEDNKEENKEINGAEVAEEEKIS